VGATLERARALDAAHVMGTYARKDVVFVEGAGMRLFDDDGREYLDFVSGLGVVNLGHAHPAVREAVCEQMSRLTHVSNLYYVEHQGEFAQAVTEMAGGGRVFMCNSGAEASEGAIKLARKWGKEAKGPSCTRIVTAERSFHGRTLAALAATGQPSKHAPFAPMPEGFSYVPLNDLDALAAAIGEDTCAVMLEPIQGEGGVHPCTEEYLKGAQELCRERDALLIMDEVQTGCWRTGPALAHQTFGIEPDIVTMAKALANGLPVGAIVAMGDGASVLGPGDHGSTFGGGPVVCAAGITAISALRAEGLGANAADVGTHLMQGLDALADGGAPVTDIRGRGLMVAADLAGGVDAGAIADRTLDSGIVVNNIGSGTLRFLPPLCCGREDVDRVLGVLGEILAGGSGS
jgi:predicted acetylornithine/succinylornithine family transaminase